MVSHFSFLEFQLFGFYSLAGGGMRIRTADILLAKQTLYQLSYTPVRYFQGL